jgi:hypothetical protein
MADRKCARGLITLLFAVVTIGTTLVLLVSALVGSGDALAEKRFQQGKEVLSLLLGVVATTLDYYDVSLAELVEQAIQLRAMPVAITDILVEDPPCSRRFLRVPS